MNSTGVLVTKEMKEALDRLDLHRDWNKHYYLVSLSKCWSGNGVKVGTCFTKKGSVLERLKPLDFAEILVKGYVYETGFEEYLNKRWGN